MINLVLMQAHSTHQVHLNLISSSDATDQILATFSSLLCCSQNRRNVISWVGVFRSEERVMEIKLTHRSAVSKRSPFRGITSWQTENRCTPTIGNWPDLCHRTGRANWSTQHGSCLHRCIVDDAVDDHFLSVRSNLNWVGCNASDLVSQVLLVRELFRRTVGAHFVVNHGWNVTPSQRTDVAHHANSLKSDLDHCKSCVIL